MLVKNFIQLAMDVELNNLASKTNKDAVKGFIYLGLLALHKRFDLVQECAVITLREGVYSYALEGNDKNVVLSNDKFSVMKVQEAQMCGKPVPINDRHKKNSIGTPRYNVVEVPECMVKEGEKLYVVYRAAPKDFVNETDQLPIPPQMIEALLHYVGYRGHAAVNGSLQGDNNTHYIRFENSCKNLEKDGLYNYKPLSSNKFEKRGFV